jgi:hypothetical protein
MGKKAQLFHANLQDDAIFVRLDANHILELIMTQLEGKVDDNLIAIVDALDDNIADNLDELHEVIGLLLKGEGARIRKSITIFSRIIDIGIRTIGETRHLAFVSTIFREK